MSAMPEVKKVSQPYLFDELQIAKAGKTPELRQSGKSVVEKLLKVRRSLTTDEKMYAPQINVCIEKIRIDAKLTDTQREELVLYSIEKQMAWTFSEICEGVKMEKEVVKAIMISLYERKIIRRVARYIPGCAKPNYLWKSNRIKIGEAD